MFSKLKQIFKAPEPPKAAEAPAPAPAPAPSPPAKEEEKKEEEKKEEEKKDEEKKDEEKKEEEKKEEAKPAPAPAPAAEPAKPEATTPAAAAADAPNADGEAAEGEPEKPKPIVINRYADEMLREVAQRMTFRNNIYKEKVLDPYASSPEYSPAVTPVYRIPDFIKKQEAERIAKEEAERKKKEDAEKKAAEKKEKEEKDKEKKAQEKKEQELKEAEEVKPEKTFKLPKFSCAWIDKLLAPIEDKMDVYLGNTIDPFTDRRYIKWLSLVTVAFNYNVWLVPARLCFPYHTPQAIPFWILFDIIFDLVNIIDIVIFQQRLQFVKGGDIIKDRAMTKVNYRASPRFRSDMMSIIPFDVLSLQFGFLSLFRFNRFLRVDSFNEFSDRLESLMAKAYIWRVSRTICYLLYLLHLNGCIYYVASDYLGLGTSKWVYDGKGSAYLRCYYYAVRTLINIGGLPEPHSVFEITFQMVNFFVGVFVFSSLIGQMRDVIGAATAGQTYFRASMDGCVAYMNANHIPKVVQQRVRTWYNYTWDAQGMLDEGELLDSMPLVMKTAIAVDINLTTFQKIDLFKGCDGQMLVDMLLRLKSIIYLPGDFVVKKGDIGKEMYIIKAGAVQVVGGPDNSIVFVTLKQGCVFGEISLLQSSANGGNRRTANVKAHGFANLFVLEKKDLFDILVHYPASQKVLARKGKKLMKAKGPAGAKADEDKKKAVTLFGPKPPTPKFLRAFGNVGKGGWLEKLKAAAAAEQQK